MDIDLTVDDHVASPMPVCCLWFHCLFICLHLCRWKLLNSLSHLNLSQEDPLFRMLILKSKWQMMRSVNILYLEIILIVFIALWCIWWLSLYLGSPHQPSTSCLHLHGMWMRCACFNSTQPYHQDSWKRTSSSGQASSQHYHFTRKCSVSMAITSRIHHTRLQRSAYKIRISMPYLWRHIQHSQVNLCP